ncbi:NADH:flavin oxidoreductase/NADH oxidase [Aurantimicrobium minutum]|uniref:NADH:flavin oxidoreductase/NADH oxidase n=1 Tax=Aurantimicrobium minutum TaxID=708131 RepID=UPI0024753F28|nr:NADH:flavin oxidoreductase/NADH oxidase [Aurantimicrobium minutum]MDH6423528.1 2,4-dienoyl-CoA reductase-like NADH-dependent reductase (Old Yellow Enzyme family) [Aurantimicrobium minutum]
MPQPALFTPFTVRNLTIRNRVWVPPMCMYSALGKDGVPTAFHTAHYGAMALGGAGLIIVEATAVNPEGRISFHDLGIWNDEQVAAFRPITAFISEQGAVPGIQLAHAGRKASTYPGWGYDGIDGTVPVEEGGWQTLGPSANSFTGYAPAHAMSEEQIIQVVADFASAARRAVEAGFKVLEIHAAHGYLIHEFLSPLTNERTDDFGGPLKNRARLLLDIVRAVRKEVGEEIVLFVRFSATDWIEGGWNEEETSIVTDWVKDLGVDVADISTGGLVAEAHIPTGPGYQVPMAHYVKEHAHLPVAAVGMITTAQQANEIVESGRADAVLIGKETLRDPHFALRAAATLGAQIDYGIPQYQWAPYGR